MLRRVVVLLLVTSLGVLVVIPVDSVLASSHPVAVAQSRAISPEVQELLNQVGSGRQLIVMDGVDQTAVAAIQAELKKANVPWVYVFLVDFPRYPEQKAQLMIALDQNPTFRSHQNAEGEVMSVAIVIDPQRLKASVLAGAGLERLGETSQGFSDILLAGYRDGGGFPGGVAAVVNRAMRLPAEHAQAEAELKARQEAARRQAEQAQAEQLAQRQRLQAFAFWGLICLVLLGLGYRVFRVCSVRSTLVSKLKQALKDATDIELGINTMVEELELVAQIDAKGLDPKSDQVLESQELVNLATICARKVRGMHEILQGTLEKTEVFAPFDLLSGHVNQYIVRVFEGEERFVLTLEVANSGVTPSLDQFLAKVAGLDGSLKGDGESYTQLQQGLLEARMELEAKSQAYQHKQQEAVKLAAQARDALSQAQLASLWEVGEADNVFSLPQAEQVVLQLKQLSSDTMQKLESGDKSGAYNGARLILWALERLEEVQSYLTEARSVVLPILVGLEDAFTQGGLGTQWPRQDASNLLDQLGKIISIYPVCVLERREKVTAQTTSWSDALRALQSKLTVASSLEQSRVDAEGVITDRSQDVVTARISLEQELVTALQHSNFGERLAGIEILCEADRNPDDDIARAVGFRQTLKEQLVADSIDSAQESNQALYLALSTASLRISETRKGIREFAASHTTAVDERERVKKTVSLVIEVLTQLQQDYAETALAVAADRVEASPSLEAVVNQAEVVLSTVEEELQHAVTAFREARILAAQESVRNCSQQTVYAETILAKVSEAKAALDQALASARLEISSVEDEYNSTETASTGHYVRAQAKQILQSASVALRQSQESLEGKPDPFSCQIELQETLRLLQSCNEAIQADHTAYTNASALIATASSEVTSAQDAIKQAEGKDREYTHGTVDTSSAEASVSQAEEERNSANTLLASQHFEEAMEAARRSRAHSATAKSLAAEAVSEAKSQHDQWIADHTPAPAPVREDYSGGSAGVDLSELADRSGNTEFSHPGDRSGDVDLGS